MKKKVVWPEPKLTSAKKRPGEYGSYQEFLQKANALREEQEQANEYLAKSMPAMVKLLELRMVNKEPLIVMRPLQYQTSTLGGIKDEEDDGFYNVRKSQNFNAKFVDVLMTINPGTQLIFKSLDPQMQEFIFEDSLGKEHAISFADRNKLLTQTNIFETIKNYFEKGDLK